MRFQATAATSLVCIIGSISASDRFLGKDLGIYQYICKFKILCYPHLILVCGGQNDNISGGRQLSSCSIVSLSGQNKRLNNYYHLQRTFFTSRERRDSNNSRQNQCIIKNVITHIYDLRQRHCNLWWKVREITKIFFENKKNN